MHQSHKHVICEVKWREMGCVCNVSEWKLKGNNRVRNGKWVWFFIWVLAWFFIWFLFRILRFMRSSDLKECNAVNRVCAFQLTLFILLFWFVDVLQMVDNRTVRWIITSECMTKVWISETCQVKSASTVGDRRKEWMRDMKGKDCFGVRLDQRYKGWEEWHLWWCLKDEYRVCVHRSWSRSG